MCLSLVHVFRMHVHIRFLMRLCDCRAILSSAQGSLRSRPGLGACLLFPCAAMSGGSRGSADPPPQPVPEWIRPTHDAVVREGRSRLTGQEPSESQQRWHHVATGGYRAPNLPPPQATPKLPGSRRSRSPARSVGETRVFGPEMEDAETWNNMAERLKTAFLSLGRKIAKFNPHLHTLVVCGRPVQVLHHKQLRRRFLFHWGVPCSDSQFAGAL